MNELQIFNYEETPVRVVDKDGAPWWVLADVCRALGIKNPRDVAARLDEDEKNTVDLTDGILARPNSELGYSRRGNPNMTIINEPGLYKVILRSDKPEAKKFTRWVTHEVLPAIRKTGSYNAKGKGDMEQGEFLAKLASETKDSRRKEILIAMAANIGLGWEVLPIPSYGEGKRRKPPREFSRYGIDEFLDEASIIGRTPGDVYREYVEFCKENSIGACEPQKMFTVAVNNRLGTYIGPKMIGRQKCRVFCG